MTDDPSYGELLTPTLLKAARSLLEMDQQDLADAAGVARKTVALIEITPPGRVDPRRRKILEQIRQRLEEDHLIVFTFANEGTGEGVRIRRATAIDRKKSR